MCEYSGNRDQALIAYLYDEIDAPTRETFVAHLTACTGCRDELASLRGVRQQLLSWAPPEATFAFTSRPMPGTKTETAIGNPASVLRNRWLREIPAWAQVAAALLFVGIAAGIANLDVRYDHTGLTVRTGWSTPAPAASVNADAAVARARVIENGDAVSRAELAALEQRLRGEIRALPGSTRATAVADVQPSRSAADADMIRRVHALLDETEKRQQRELALRVGEVLRDVNAQRQADLVRIERSLGLVENNLGVEVLKQRQSLNYLMRVNQR